MFYSDCDPTDSAETEVVADTLSCRVLGQTGTLCPTVRMFSSSVFPGFSVSITMNNRIKSEYLL
jgi:hypothetical protein